MYEKLIKRIALRDSWSEDAIRFAGVLFRNVDLGGISRFNLKFIPPGMRLFPPGKTVHALSLAPDRSSPPPSLFSAIRCNYLALRELEATQSGWKPCSISLASSGLTSVFTSTHLSIFPFFQTVLDFCPFMRSNDKAGVEEEMGKLQEAIVEVTSERRRESTENGKTRLSWINLCLFLYKNRTLLPPESTISS